MNGPLKGVKIIEMAGIGPGPFCGMLLADMGADVVRVDRIASHDKGINFAPEYDLLNRSKRSIAVDLKTDEGLQTVLKLIAKADGLIEGFRPGVMERLGLGPNICIQLNPKLCFGRITGWGQNGPLANAAGHDLNYISLTGVTHSMGRPDNKPMIPLNLIGDFGGGALYLAMGLLAALLHAKQSGQGQVVDAAMIDGAASLMTMQYAIFQMGQWISGRGANILDGGAPFYNVYETSDCKYISIAPIEKKFYEELMSRLGIDIQELPPQNSQAHWSQVKAKLEKIFLTQTRDHWCALLEGTDACFSPVLDLMETEKHPHHVARQTYTRVHGVLQVQPAPRFSQTPSAIQNPPHLAGADNQQVLKDWGI
ncbi:MAG: CoA transferase [Limnohabitans sp.]|nr:CoA transferase [Limnohabitans sp.]